MTDNELYIEPSLTQLAAMAREEPESLEYVSNFRVVHRKHGSVSWTESIDVRGLDLDDIVLFSPGAVDVSFQHFISSKIYENLISRCYAVHF